MSENYLLTGASGSLGTYLMDAWGNNPQYYFTGRSPNTQHHYYQGDITDEQFLDTLVRQLKISTIIHNAANTQIWGPWSSFENSNIAMMKTLIKVAKKHGIRIIFLSTSSIYHFSNRTQVDETYQPTKFPNFYAESKYYAENILKESGVPFIIFRPRAVVGRTDQTLLPKLLNQYHKGRLSIIGNGDNLADFTAMRNIQHAIDLSLQADHKAWSHLYNLSNGQATNVYGLINNVLEGVGLEAISKKVPVGVALTYGWLMELIGKIRAKEPVITRYQMELLFLNYTISIAKIEQLLNYTPIQTNSEMVEELIQAYKK